MGYAPVPALRKQFEQTGTTPADIDTVELNEAFAAQAVAVIRDAGVDPEKASPYGGAIALGHQVGATGAILTLRAARDLVRRDLELGVVTMCIGGGQVLAALFRRVRSSNRTPVESEHPMTDLIRYACEDGVAGSPSPGRTARTPLTCRPHTPSARRSTGRRTLTCVRSSCSARAGGSVPGAT
ncbi:hypothetical protein [Streptomyces umbrinus]|uniref:hypothetical protein n=1 Tax=Streptomyces umbrinus TaxID=67370 RepID=UPI00216AC0BC|nr:hypothetical protein [Streptomyces umbrinus]